MTVIFNFVRSYNTTVIFVYLGNHFQVSLVQGWRNEL